MNAHDHAPAPTPVDAAVDALAAPRGVLLRLIDFYQRAADGRPSPCRFTPSCSSYAKEALELHGRRRGLWLTVRRLARCRPFGPSGFDPVPERQPRSASSGVALGDPLHAATQRNS